jgi:type IV pilus assembly protein PilB
VVAEAIKKGASDIHIEATATNVIFKYRVDGDLVIVREIPMTQHQAVIARIKILANLKLDERRKPQDGHFSIDFQGRKIDFRVSTMPSYFGETVVLRILDTYKGVRDLENLNIYPTHLAQVKEALNYPYGIVLITGPTGSGKTSTLYSMLNSLDKEDRNIVSLEDPIEYSVAGVNQSQVAPDIGYTFANGLRSILRQDPDVIMVGEIRDNETASLAINASLTGHLVLSTLHTNSAAGAVPRLIDMKVEPFLIISTLDAIIGQRLVRKLSDKKEKYNLSKAELESISKVVNMDKVLEVLKQEKIVDKKDDWKDIDFYRPEKDAGEDGFKGRIGIYEVFNVSSAIKDLIIKGATVEEMEIQAKKEGMLTMIEDGIFKAVQGLTTIEEVLRVVSE